MDAATFWRTPTDNSTKQVFYRVKVMVRPARLERATSWFVARRNEATGGSWRTTAPRIFGAKSPPETTRNHRRQSRFVCRFSVELNRPGDAGCSNRLTASPGRRAAWDRFTCGLVAKDSRDPRDERSSRSAHTDIRKESRQVIAATRKRQPQAADSIAYRFSRHIQRRCLRCQMADSWRLGRALLDGSAGDLPTCSPGRRCGSHGRRVASSHLQKGRLSSVHGME
jgi:hypothetical protein